MPPIDTYLYVLLSYVALYSIVQLTYRKILRSRIPGTSDSPAD